MLWSVYLIVCFVQNLSNEKKSETRAGEKYTEIDIKYDIALVSGVLK